MIMLINSGANIGFPHVLIAICRNPQRELSLKMEDYDLCGMNERKQREIKNGRGAQINTHNRFERYQYSNDQEYLEHLYHEGEDPSLDQKTKFTRVYPKSIVNKVNSPDLRMAWSMNPYQGCEHGCAYCYARNSHEYWGFSAGSEFEQQILVKPTAPELLEKFLQKPSWQPEPIMLSGNTDCYQPAEKEFEITRKLLQVLLRYRNPAGIITKNALILRDLDILQEMAQKNLVKVSLSITTLDENIRRKLEPRTATAKKRLQTVEMLSSRGIPVNVMIAPVIPGLTSHEVFNIAKASAEAGAYSVNYTMVRLNGQIGRIFMDWADTHFPDKAQKIRHLVEQTHGGKLNDSEYGRRMRGEGQVAEQVKSMIELARKKYFSGRSSPQYNLQDFVRAPKGQLGLF